MSEDAPQFPRIEGEQQEQQPVPPEVAETAKANAPQQPETASTGETEGTPEKRAEKLATEIVESSKEGRELRWKAAQAALKNHNFSMDLSERNLYELRGFSNTDYVGIDRVISKKFDTPQEHTGYNSWGNAAGTTYYPDSRIKHQIHGLNVDVRCSVENSYKTPDEYRLVYDLQQSPFNEEGKHVRVVEFPPPNTLYGRYEVVVKGGKLEAATYQPVQRGKDLELVNTDEAQMVHFEEQDEHSAELIRLMELHHEGQKKLLDAFGEDVASEDWMRVNGFGQYKKVSDWLEGSYGWGGDEPSILLGGRPFEFVRGKPQVIQEEAT